MNNLNLAIDLPALLFSPNYDSLEVIANRDLLTVTNKMGLKKGVVLGNFIVDSSRQLFKTIHAKKRSNYFPFWKFEFFNPLMYIELKVEKIKDDYDLSELKRQVLKIVDKNKESWINHGDIHEIKTSITKPTTHQELIAVMKSYVYTDLESDFD